MKKFWPCKHIKWDKLWEDWKHVMHGTHQTRVLDERTRCPICGAVRPRRKRK